MNTTIIDDAFAEVIGAAEAGDRKASVTLESRSDPNAWVQLRWDYVNVSYPTDTEPYEFLATVGIAMPEGMTLEEWEPEKFALFEHAAFPTEPLVMFVTAYLRDVLGTSISPFTLKATRE